MPIAPAAPPELILHHGRITTLNPGQPEAQAIALREGLVLATGSDAEVLPLAGPATRLVDLGGRRVIPGLAEFLAQWTKSWGKDGSLAKLGFVAAPDEVRTAALKAATEGTAMTGDGLK